MSDLLGNEAVWLVEDGPAFRVADDDPIAPAVLDHLGGDLATEVTSGNLSGRKKNNRH